MKAFYIWMATILILMGGIVMAVHYQYLWLELLLILALVITVGKGLL